MAVSLALLMLLASYCTDVLAVRFFTDESIWIAESSFFETFLTNPRTPRLQADTNPNRADPPIPRLVIGASRRIGGYSAVDLNQRWQNGLDESENLRAGARPSEGLLWWSRIGMALLSVGCTFAVFCLLLQSYGGLAACIWLAAGCVSLYFRANLSRAMSEAPLLAGVTFTVVCCVLALRAMNRNQPHGWRRVLGLLCIMGIGVGLTGNAKLNGLSLLPIGMGAALLAAFRMADRPMRSFGMAIAGNAVFLFFTAAAFIGINPYVWPEPAVRTARMFTTRFEMMRIQTANYPDRDMSDLDSKLRIIPLRIFFDYSAWKTGIYDPWTLWLPTEEGGRFQFPLVLSKNELAPEDWFLWGLNLASFLSGFFLLAIRARDWLFRRGSDSVAVAIIAVGMAASAPIVLSSLDWSRYYLLPIWFCTMVSAVGLAWYARAVLRWMKSLREGTRIRSEQLLQR